jgi:hypothetical protein
MNPIPKKKIYEYVEKNIHGFHKKRIEKLTSLRLKEILKRKNPYLFKAKNVQTASDLIKYILDAYLSSQEETLFGSFLEELAIYICSYVFDGAKTSTEGMDLKFKRDGVIYIVTIKSGPNWGNSSQIQKMKDQFNKARRILNTNVSKPLHIIAVNGCCYGKENSPNKGDYLKICGQQFWELISGDDRLYIEIIEPLGYKARENNEKFLKEYSKIVNRFSLEFMNLFCSADGEIQWDKLVAFNSAHN